MMFLVQIGSADRFTLARDIDPAMGRPSMPRAPVARKRRPALPPDLRPE